MTDIMNDSLGGSRIGAGHVGDLNLRRLWAGESLGAEHDRLAAHAASCVDCARRLTALAEEQRLFEEQISFDRFTAGVKRAARVPAPTAAGHWWGRPASTRSFVTVISVGSVAAVLALVAGVRPLFDSAHRRQPDATEAEQARGLNNIKGGGGLGRADVIVRVASQNSPAEQRTAANDAPEPLAVGERIRVGVQPGNHGFLFAISIDDQGLVTPLYPENGNSLSMARGKKMQYLPDSLELTGKGTERLVVLLTDQSLDWDAVRHAATAAFHQAGGDLSKLPDLAVATKAEQFHRMFIKP